MNFKTTNTCMVIYLYWVTHNQQHIWNTDIVMKLIQLMKLVEITNQFLECVLIYNILIIYLHGSNGPADYIARYYCIV